MTINVVLIILSFAIGFGTDQSVNTNWTIEDKCYRNGIWYNPCPPGPPPPDDTPTDRTPPPEA